MLDDREVEDLLRRLAPQVLGALVRRYGHFDTAEDAVQEALLAAATQWPADGIPRDPRGWLITVASRRLTDLLRSEQARQRRENIVAERTPIEGCDVPDLVIGQPLCIRSLYLARTSRDWFSSGSGRYLVAAPKTSSAGASNSASTSNTRRSCSISLSPPPTSEGA